MEKMKYELYLELISAKKEGYKSTGDKEMARQGRKVVGEFISYIKRIYGGRELTSEEMAFRLSLGFDINESKIESLEQKLMEPFE